MKESVHHINDLSLDNYRDHKCPLCGSMLWLNSATYYAQEGIHTEFWVNCFSLHYFSEAKKCGFAQKIKESVVGRSPGPESI